MGFLPFIPYSASWYLQGYIRIVLDLESKELGRQITLLSHFWFWKNTACLDLLTRRFCGHPERSSVMVHYKLQSWVQMSVIFIAGHGSNTLRVLIPCDTLRRPSLGVPRSSGTEDNT